MPLFEFQCPICGLWGEYIESAETEIRPCENCCGEARRLFSFGQSFEFREDANWIKTVLEVVEKDGHDRVDKVFLDNPTRTNYRRWMKHHGLKPMENEHGGPVTSMKKTEPDLSKINDYCTRKRMERNWESHDEG